MTVYIDITQLDRSRGNTGIQRVVKEFLNRALNVEEKIAYKIISYNFQDETMELLNNNEIIEFLKDVKNFEFNEREKIDITNIVSNETTILFDIDSCWNGPLHRLDLYPKLKENGFLIFNFIYDLTPILLPQYAQEITVKNFESFLKSVYLYSDMVMFDSLSANTDFINTKKLYNITRDIPTRTIGLGSDFLKREVVISNEQIKDILNKKYILFVGTIEARKNHEDVLNAFETLEKKYPDLNLVFIGKKGWKVDSLVNRVLTHNLKDKKIFWLNNIDDNTLSSFYANAYIVTYLSKYEGYGLPIAESLQYGNVTITSKNSSMYEVGKDFADYVVYNSKNELVDIISMYCDDKYLYDKKKEFIKNNFKSTSWKTFANSTISVFNNFEKSVSLKKDHLNKLQFVFISIDLENLQGTINACDKYVDFIKEYIVVTSPSLLSEFNKIETKNKIKIIDETTILKEYAKDFHKKDHQTKNWLLRASLINLEYLDTEFIMLDDDNRPLKYITIDKFISSSGSYNSYYYYNLLEWNNYFSDYDKGQRNTSNVLSSENYELLSYSSHAPQIINKSILKEVVDKFFSIGLQSPIDEWSIYFNYAISEYPYAFNKKKFETLNWPDLPVHWDNIYIPSTYSFENYYKEVYDTKMFNSSNTYEEKLNLKKNQIAPFLKSREFFEDNKVVLSKNNMVHGVCSFNLDDLNIYISNIPYYLVTRKNSDIKLKLNYKILNPKLIDANISMVIFLDGNRRTMKKFEFELNKEYQEAILEMPISSSQLNDGMYNITFDIKINDTFVYKEKSPYLLKLVVSNNNDMSAPKTIDFLSLKDRIKSIPFLGWFARWNYNLLRLNNIKHNTYTNRKRMDTLEDSLNNQINQTNILINKISEHSKIIKAQEIKIEEQKQIILEQEKQIKSSVAKQISFQSDSFHQRIDQFIFDNKTELKK